MPEMPLIFADAAFEVEISKAHSRERKPSALAIMDCMASLSAPRLTEEQYLQTERLAEAKSEFHHGRMFAMSGGSLNRS
jgi:hypothetical protein